ERRCCVQAMQFEQASAGPMSEKRKLRPAWVVVERGDPGNGSPEEDFGMKRVGATALVLAAVVMVACGGSVPTSSGTAGASSGSGGRSGSASTGASSGATGTGAATTAAGTGGATTAAGTGGATTAAGTGGATTAAG